MSFLALPVVPRTPKWRSSHVISENKPSFHSSKQALITISIVSVINIVGIEDWSSQHKIFIQLTAFGNRV